MSTSPAPGNHHDPAKDPEFVRAQTGQVIGAVMTEQPLEGLIPDARAAVLTESMGACVTFDGVVRDHDGGQRVSTLTYTSHPTAQAEIERVTGEVISSHPHVRLWTAHRTGALRIGERAFVVIAASAHRRAAFEAAAELADAVKAHVPIWKEQTLADGSAHWVGLE